MSRKRLSHDGWPRSFEPSNGGFRPVEFACDTAEKCFSFFHEGGILARVSPASGLLNPLSGSLRGTISLSTLADTECTVSNTCRYVFAGRCDTFTCIRRR